MLWKDRQTITIQFPTNKDLEELNPDSPVPEWELEVRVRRAYGNNLEIVVGFSNLAQSQVDALAETIVTHW